MKNWRKCALLCLLAVLILTVGAAACEGGECLRRWEVDCIGEEPAEESVVLQETDLQGAEEALVRGMREMRSSISVREYQIALEDFPALNEHISSNNPDLFMVYGCGYGYSGNTVTTVYPKYIITPEEYPAAKAVYEGGVAAIVEQVDPGWSKEEQLLYIHDYIASHFEYDMRVYDPSVNPNSLIYDAYNFFRYGVGVCQAYTMVFMAAARELGFEVSYVESGEMSHIWDLVELDGNWYHVDVTWDDPVEDHLGYAGHKHFLTSDAQSAVAHRDDASDWIYGNGRRGTDTTYDQYFWTGAVSPFLNVDGVWYAVTEEGLKTWDGSANGFGETLDSFEAPYSGLTLYNGRLYYNGYYGVRCYELFAGKNGEVLNFAKTHGSRHYGQGLRIEGDTLTYQCYWWEGDVVKQGTSTIKLEAYTSAANGSFGYYVEDGTLYLNGPSACVAVACYDGSGRMTGSSLLTGTKSCTLQKGQVKLIAMTANGWLPCGEAVKGSV